MGHTSLVTENGRYGDILVPKSNERHAFLDLRKCSNRVWRVRKFYNLTYYATENRKYVLDGREIKAKHDKLDMETHHHDHGD